MFKPARAGYSQGTAQEANDVAVAAKESEAMEELSALELKLKMLRKQMEQYFLGIERLPPTDEWEAVKREMAAMMRRHFNNTAVKFRRNSLNQRLVGDNTYYTRTLKQIEEGTYHRHKFKADLKEKQRLRMENEQQAKAAASAPAAAAAAAAKPKGGGAIDSLHSAYIAARAKTGEGGNVSREALQSVIEKQVAAIKQRYNCKRVEFKVAIENGKAKLKAVPKN